MHMGLGGKRERERERKDLMYDDNSGRDKLDATVQSCVECYTSDFVVVRRKHQHLSSSSKIRSAVSEE